MSTRRTQRYKGFDMEIVHLPHWPDIEVFAVRNDYPGLAVYCNDIKEAKRRIDEYWEKKR